MPFVKSVADETAKSLIGLLADAYVKPHLQKVVKKRNKRQALDELTFFGGFQKYLERAYVRHSHMTTLALQNKPRLLRELYVPLTLVKNGHHPTEREEIEISCYPQNLLPQLRRVLVTDDAGMGKSTLVKFLFLECIDSQSALPILIELRRLGKGKAISDVIVDELCEVCPDVERDAMSDAVRELLRAGEFVFFLDGYDEIPLDQRESVTSYLRDFIAKASVNDRNHIFVSSRPEEGVTALTGFHNFHIRSLEVQEAFDLLRKYDSDGTLAEQLIAELEQQMESVGEFLTNPMLVSLLFEAYDHTRNIPLKKAAFYRQVFDALFERHDTTKPLYKREKHSKLDKDDFDRVLRALAILTLKSGVGYAKDVLLNHIAEAHKMCPGLNFSESGFLQDLLTTVPLFAREGDYHRWKHKSLQEYFAARYICGDISKEEQCKFLRRLVEENRYINVLSLCYDLDYRTFRNSVTYDLVCSFLDYFNTSYAYVDNRVPEDSIRLRKQVCFMRQFVAFSSDFVSTHRGGGTGEFKKMEEEASKMDIAVSSNTAGSMSLGNAGAVLMVSGVKTDLIRFLGNKGETILINIKPSFTQKNRIKYKLPNGRHKEFEVELPFTPDQLCDADVFRIDDDATSPWNNVETFEKTNSLLTFVAQGFPGLAFDPDACRQLKAEIEADLEGQQFDLVLSLI